MGFGKKFKLKASAKVERLLRRMIRKTLESSLVSLRRAIKQNGEQFDSQEMNHDEETKRLFPAVTISN
jgi:hypothetical protein